MALAHPNLVGARSFPLTSYQPHLTNPSAEAEATPLAKLTLAGAAHG